MRIAINALLLGKRISGVEVYIYNFLKALRQLDNANTYFIFVSDKANLNPGLSARDNFNFLVIKGGSHPLKRAFYEQACLRGELSRLRIDLFHSLGFTVPLRCPVKSVVTVHDLIFELYPAFIPYHKKLYYDFFVGRSLKEAAKIISISENTKADTMRLFGIPGEKVKVVYLGPDIRYKPLDKSLSRNKVFEIFGVREDFILYAGRIEPRKNVSRLISAFLRVKEKDKIRHKLLIAGPLGWPYRSASELIRDRRLRDQVVFLGVVEDEELLYLYNASSLFIYPSLYEGFGLPVIEAMACGAPVITSNNSSMREIASGSALLADPYDTDKLAEAIRLILKDDPLRNELVRKGLLRAGGFSWEEAARETISLYKEAAANSPLL